MRKALLCLLLVAASAAQAAPEIDCTTASEVVRFSLSRHLLYRSMTPELASRAAGRFVEEALSMKGVLTASDSALLSEELRAVDPARLGQSMESGDCSFFESEASVLRSSFQRLRATFLVPELLSAEIAAVAAGPAPLGPENIAPAAAPVTVEELHLRIVENLGTQARAWVKEVGVDEAALFVARRYLNSLNALERALEGFGPAGMLQAFTLALDPHSIYHMPSESAAFVRSALSSSSVGIGVFVYDQPMPRGPRVKQIVPGTPAAFSGQIHEEDVILAIDGESMEGVDISEVGQRMMGPEGSALVLRVARLERGQAVDVREVRLVRARIENAAVAIRTSRREIRGKSVVTLRLTQFYKGSGRDVRAALEGELARGRIDALVLDLRGNPGGVVDDAVEIASLFAGAAPVVGIRYSDGSLEKKSLRGAKALYSGPLVVAINNGSASASEIVAGTLKDLGRALIAGGEHSFGKGTVQFVFNGKPAIPSGLLTLTMGQFFTESGHSTQREGVKSDLVVAGPSGLAPALEERNQRYALPPAAIAPLGAPGDLFKGYKRPVAALLPQLKKELSGRSRPDADGAAQLAEIEELAADFAALEAVRARRGD